MIPAPRFEKIRQLGQYLNKHRPSIQEVVREQTSGGIVFRRNKNNEIEILLIQDAKDRWTIPKGHIEPEEAAQATAEREIREEVGLQEMEILSWLGKINFRYRREQSLVLMTMQIHLVRALGDTDNLRKEKWINNVQWFPFLDALDKIEYDDIRKLMLIAMKKIRNARL